MLKFRKEKEVFSLAALSFIAITLILLTFAPKATAASEQLIFRYQSRAPKAHFISEAETKFVQAVEERTNGKYKIEQYFTGQLYKDSDMPQVLASGVLDMGSTLSVGFFKIVPEVMIIGGLPGLGTSSEQFHKALDGKLGEVIDKAFQEKANIKVVAWLELGGTDAIISTKKQIRTMEDFKGLLLRAPGRANQLFVEDLGGSPVDISSSEMYTALQHGTIDGVITALDSVVARKLYEAAPYVTFAPISYAVGTGIGMNLDKWNRLPLDTQKIFLDSGKLATKYSRTNSWNVKTEAIKFLKARPKVHFYEVPKKEFSAWQDKVLSNQINKLFNKIAGKEKAKELLDILASY